MSGAETLQPVKTEKALATINISNPAPEVLEFKLLTEMWIDHQTSCPGLSLV
jgi:hypothetical protein